VPNPGLLNCFSYPADVPPGIRNRTSAEAALRDPRRMPLPCFSYPLMCFSYPDDVPLGNRNRGGAQPTSPEVRSMPYPCFRY
jgi:hypothetical protein